MGTKYLIDTNAVIEFLGDNFSTASSKWLQNIIDDELVQLSVICQIELLGFNTSINEMRTLQDFVNANSVIQLTNDVVQKTIELRRKYKIKLPDAIIAATALVYNLTIVTRNINDFDKIDSLVCLDAHKQ